MTVKLDARGIDGSHVDGSSFRQDGGVGVQKTRVGNYIHVQYDVVDDWGWFFAGFEGFLGFFEKFLRGFWGLFYGFFERFLGFFWGVLKGF